MTSFNLAASVAASMHHGGNKSGAGTSRPHRSLPCPHCFGDFPNLDVHLKWERPLCADRIAARQHPMSRHPSTRQS